MPPFTLKVVTDASSHHHIGYKITGSDSCAYGEGGVVVLENYSSSSNHSTAHSFTRHPTASIGTSIRAYTRTYGGASTKKIDMYINGKLVDTNTRNAQCVHTYHVLTESDFKRSSDGRPPLYLEQLYKLNTKQNIVYDPTEKRSPP